MTEKASWQGSEYTSAECEVNCLPMLAICSNILHVSNSTASLTYASSVFLSPSCLYWIYNFCGNDYFENFHNGRWKVFWEKDVPKKDWKDWKILKDSKSFKNA